MSLTNKYHDHEKAYHTVCVLTSLLQNQRFASFRHPIVSRQQGVVQRLDCIHEAIMGSAHHDDDAVVGADRCASQWRQHDAWSIAPDVGWRALV